MTRDELILFHTAMCERARELMQQKNADYANAEDPFRNFRRHGLKGIAVRLSDKLARLESFIENSGELKVKDETIVETCEDLLNYAVLFAALATEEK
jgi:hypothetical protein